MNRSILLAFLLGYISYSANAQWKKVLTRQETVACVATNGKSIYVGTLGGGAFVSEDIGEHWMTMSPVMPNSIYLTSIAFADNNVLAGTAQNGLFLTHNKKAWYEIRNGFNSYQVNAFIVDGMRVFAATYDGVFLSKDYGRSWAAVNQGLLSKDVRCLSMSGNFLFAGTKSGGIFLLDNNSLNWTSVNIGMPENSIVSLACADTLIFAGTYSHGIYFSDNNGLSWSAANKGLLDTAIHSLRNAFKDVLINSYGMSLDTSKGQFPIVHSLIIKKNLVFASSGKSIFLYNAEEQNWIDIGKGVIDPVNVLVASDEYLFAGGFSSGVWRRSLSEFPLLKNKN